MAHSMGNKTVHYFIHWVVNTYGTTVGNAWIDRYLHSFFAVAGPFLGASEAFKAAMMGEDFGPCAPTMRVELIGHFKPCMTEICLHL